MQFNIYVPKSKLAVIQALERQAEKQGVAKSELILQAAAEFLARQNAKPFQLPSFDMGIWKMPTRAEMYGDRERKIERLGGA